MYRLASTRIRYKQAHSVAEHHGPGPSRRYSKRQKYATTKSTGPISADGVVVGYPGLHLLCPLLVIATGHSELQMMSYQSYNPKNEGTNIFLRTRGHTSTFDTGSDLSIPMDGLYTNFQVVKWLAI